jgi:hypothetical protein
MHLVPVALEHVEQGLVLMAVPVVAPAGLDGDEMNVQALGPETIFQFSLVPAPGEDGVNTRGTVRSRSRRCSVSP